MTLHVFTFGKKILMAFNYSVFKILEAHGASDVAATAINTQIQAIQTVNDVPPIIVATSANGTQTASSLFVTVQYTPIPS